MTEPFVRRQGQGARRALLIHCSLAHSGAWTGVMAQLNAQLDMLAFDLPGHGRSPDWDGEKPYPEVAFDMADALLDEPMDIIGHSFGATTALQLALDRPDLVRSLVMIEPVLFSTIKGTEIEKKFPRNYARVEAALAAGDVEEATRVFMSSWGDDQAWDKVPKDQQTYFVERIPLVDAAQCSLYDDYLGFVPRLSQVSCPTLLMMGETTPPVMGAILDKLEAAIPDVTRLEIEGASHMAPITHPKQVSAAISEFLSE